MGEGEVLGVKFDAEDYKTGTEREHSLSISVCTVLPYEAVASTSF